MSLSYEQKFQKSYNNLNLKQKEAVDNIYWPLMVVAWPWTGKTQILGLRAANIILKTWVNPGNILITTFTEAWVIALKKRLFDFIWPYSYKINICTIHSFCNDVILAFPEKFLEYRAMRPIDEIEQIEILENILENSNFEALSSEYDKFFYLKDIKDRISKLKQEWILPEEFKPIIESQRELNNDELSLIDPKLKKYATTQEKLDKWIKKLEELLEIYIQYLSICRQKWVYDFADMIDFVLKNLKKDSNLRNHYALQYQFIMIDEFQDTNNAQNEIIDLILSESDDKNIMIVGDDDQSIYRFQWANLENMLNFSTKYPQTKFVVLDTNYRSNQAILDLASESIKNNSSRITNYIKDLSKNLTSYKNDNIVPEFLMAKNSIDEKAFVLNKIKSFLDSWVKIEEIAVILRTNREVEEWWNFLQINWISVESKLKSNIFNSKYVSYLIDLISVIIDPYANETKLVNILRSWIFDVRNVDTIRALRRLSTINYTKKYKDKLFDFLSDEEELSKLFPIKEDMVQMDLFTAQQNNIDSPETIDKIKNFTQTILLCQSGLGSNFYAFLKDSIQKTLFIDFVEKNGTFSDIEDIFTLLNVVKNWVTANNSFNHEDFLKKIYYYNKYNIAISRNILKDTLSWVQVLTAHQSKWLEYEIVFLPSLNLWNWWERKVRELIKLPFQVVGSSISETLKNTDSNEEERRLFFVGMTRAKNNLFLSFYQQDESKIKLQSNFLGELNPVYNAIEVDIENIVKNEFKPILHNTSLDREEELYIAEFLKNYKLSPSDLNKFIEDPKLFLKDVIFKYPFEDNEFTIFGRVYHKALEYFYLNLKKNWIKQSRKTLEDNFVKLLKQEFLTPEEFEKLKNKWLLWIEGWYDLVNTDNVPLELEYDFRFRNIYLDWIPLTGKIDKIEQVSNDEINIIDYKTGKAKTINEITWKNANSDGKYFRQLLFYKIMLDLDSNFAFRYNKVNLMLEFVEWKDWQYPSLAIDYDLDLLNDLKELIRDSRQKISNIEFWKELS